LPWRKHYSVLDFLTSSAFVGTKPSTFVADACLYRRVSGARIRT
jgi:hypothetical protein